MLEGKQRRKEVTLSETSLLGKMALREKKRTMKDTARAPTISTRSHSNRYICDFSEANGHGPLPLPASPSVDFLEPQHSIVLSHVQDQNTYCLGKWLL